MRRPTKGLAASPSLSIVRRPRLGSAPIELQQAAQALIADDLAIANQSTLDQLVAETLVVAFDVVMREVLLESATEVAFAEQDHPVEALLLDRAHEALCVGVGVRGLERRSDHPDAGRLQHDPEPEGELRVAVV